MRLALICLTFLLTRPVESQTGPIRPSPSVLFVSPRRVGATDSVKVGRGLTIMEGAAIGAVVGGVGIVLLAEHFHWDEQGDGEPAIFMAPIGALIGFVVGGSLAQGH